jgi:hypothetical protein
MQRRPDVESAVTTAPVAADIIARPSVARAAPRDRRLRRASPAARIDASASDRPSTSSTSATATSGIGRWSTSSNSR